MDKPAIEKKATEYDRQAEEFLANYHRLKGAAIALRELLKEPEPPSEQVHG